MSGALFWSLAVWLIVVQQACSSSESTLGDACYGMPPCAAMAEGAGTYEQYYRLYRAAQGGNLTGVTEPQVKQFCQMHVGVLTCQARHLQGCLPAVPRLALHAFLEDTIALGAFCERPDLYAKTKVLAACAQTVDSIYSEDFYIPINGTYSVADHRRYFREVQTCTEGVFRHEPVEALSALSPFLINEVLQRRHDYQQATSTAAVKKNVCCELKKLSTCFPALTIIRAKCTTEFTDLTKTIFSAALQHYACTDELSTVGCPSTARAI